MIRITAHGNEPIEKLVRRFRKKCEREGLIRDIRRSEFYEKPSERKRREQRRSARRMRMEAPTPAR